MEFNAQNMKTFCQEAILRQSETMKQMTREKIEKAAARGEFCYYLAPNTDLSITNWLESLGFVCVRHPITKELQVRWDK